MKIIDAYSLSNILSTLEKEEKIETLKKYDVITTATFAVISAVSFIFELKFATPGRYKYVQEAYIENDKVLVGPAPNEGLGILDGIINRPSFLDKLLKKDKVSVLIKVIDYDNKIDFIKFKVSKNDFLYSKLLFTRVCVKNYMAFVSEKKEKTIFSYDYLDKGEITFSGCGVLNPLEIFNIKEGEKIFIAGTWGLVLGPGTRSSKEKPNLSVLVDFKNVDRKFFGSFKQKSSLEFYVGMGYKRNLKDFDKKEIDNILTKSMKNIKLPIAKVQGRQVIDFSNYKEAWDGDLMLKFNKNHCHNCSTCLIEENCPAQAFSKEEGFLNNCLYCGICLKFCPFGATSGYLGKIKNYKIKMRHSSLYRALEICKFLKDFAYS